MVPWRKRLSCAMVENRERTSAISAGVAWGEIKHVDRQDLVGLRRRARSGGQPRMNLVVRPIRAPPSGRNSAPWTFSGGTLLNLAMNASSGTYLSSSTPSERNSACQPGVTAPSNWMRKSPAAGAWAARALAGADAAAFVRDSVVMVSLRSRIVLV